MAGATESMSMPSQWGMRRPFGAPNTRNHLVTAVLVCHNGAEWLPRTLAALAACDRRPDRIVAVDTGSTDSTPDLLASTTWLDEIVTLPADTGFGAAVAAGVAAAGGHVDLTDSGPLVPWLWILHDDCAVEPDTLAALLAAADQSTSATVLGPKIRGWYQPELLVECGTSMSQSGRRFTGLEPADRDQGQRDDASDVLAVSSAGMLVDQRVWDRLGGFDPTLSFFRDDTEFCMRARRADERVVVVPEAVVHHLEAAARGFRPVAATGLPPVTADRAAALHTLLVHTPAWRLPLTSLRLLIGTFIRCLVFLLARAPRRALRELRVWTAIHLRPDRVFASRRRLAAVSVAPRKEITELQPSWWDQALLFGERAASWFRAPAGIALPAIRPGAALSLTVALFVIAALATRSVWAGQGPLAGGALLPAADGSTLWAAFRSSWHDVGLGSSEAAAPYVLALVGLAAPPVVSVELVTQTLLLFTVPLAGLSMFLALRGVRNLGIRTALATAYALTPAAVVPSLDGRLGTAVVAILLPWFARLAIRLVVVDRAPEVLPPARLRTVVTAALVLTVLVAFVPLMGPVAALLLTTAALAHLRRPGYWLGVVFVLLVPIGLLYPWSLGFVADPSRFAFEAGIASADLVPTGPLGWRLLLLDVGTVSQWSVVAAAGLAAAALLALIPARHRPLVVWAWVTVITGLALATLLSSQQFVPLGATTAQVGFVGPMTVVMAAGYTAAVAVALGGARLGPGWGTRVVPSLTGVLLLVGPVFFAGLWVTQLDGPLQRSDTTVVPAFVTEQALSSDRIRTLVLREQTDGTVAYTLVNGAGGQIGDADVAPPPDTWTVLSAAVGLLAAGAGPEAAQTLAAQAVAYVVADSKSSDLAARLDGNPGLRRLSTNDGRGLWEVLGLTTRAQVINERGPAPVPMLSSQESADSLGTLLSSPVPVDGPQTLLRIAQANDGQFRALVDGTETAVSGEGELVILLGQRTEGVAQVEVLHEQQARDQALLVPAGLGILLLLMLIPTAGRARPLADPAEDQAQLTVDLTESTVDLTEEVTR